MQKKIAFLGTAGDPFGTHHLRIAEAIAASGIVTEVRLWPCGPRPDKPNLTAAHHRGEMTLLGTQVAAGNIVVDLSDVNDGIFRRNHEIQTLLAPQGLIYHTVGADWLKGGARGESLIQRMWVRGEELWASAHFLVLTRPGYELDQADLPPRSEFLQLDIPGSSTEIRIRVLRGESIDGLAHPDVASYIYKHGLYLPKEEVSR